MSSPGLEARIRAWDGLGLVTRFDAPTGCWFFIALHDDTLGRPTGGTRVKLYASAAEGLLDAQRLAAGMTSKWAAIELECGGGKAVLALSRPLEPSERRGLLERYADLLSSLRGSFATGQDLGTTPGDMRVLARRTRYVHGFDPASDSMADPGPFTARGVFSGIRAACAHLRGTDDLAGVRVLIQGVGDVGRPLARQCAEAGAELLLTDVDTSRAEQLAVELGGRALREEETLDTECEVFAPCAVGGILDAGSIARLRCKIVAGSANNQLAETADAGRLHRRGILYAPDYVINAGGAIAFGLRNLHDADDTEIDRRLRGLGDILAAIFDESAGRGESPATAAERRVRRVLERARASRG